MNPNFFIVGGAKCATSNIAYYLNDHHDIFIPELNDINSNLEFSAHNFKTKGKMKVKNLNAEKIEKLTKDQMREINSHFIKERELLVFFGYTIIE